MLSLTQCRAREQSACAHRKDQFTCSNSFHFRPMYNLCVDQNSLTYVIIASLFFFTVPSEAACAISGKRNGWFGFSAVSCAAIAGPAVLLSRSGSGCSAGRRPREPTLRHQVEVCVHRSRPRGSCGSSGFMLNNPSICEQDRVILSCCAQPQSSCR